MLKMINSIDLVEFDWMANEIFDIEKWAFQINKLICKIYEYPEYFGIEEYVEKFKIVSVNLVKKASSNIASVLNSKVSDPRQFTGNDHFQQCNRI